MQDQDWRPATMAEVAVDAGVSIPTVSRVINRSGPVAEQTREAVLGSIERLGYHPNPMARGLSRGRSNAVLVILPHITEPSVAMRLSGLIDEIRETQLELHIVDVERPVEERLSPLGDVVSVHRPAGVIIISLRPDEIDLRRFRESSVPVVLIDTPSSELPTDVIDDVAGGEMATRHLIDLGHQEIGFIGDDESTTIGAPASADRRRGFVDAMRAAGLSIRDEYVAMTQPGTDPARLVAEKMLAHPQRPSAIFAASDVQAFGVMAAARNVGISIPDGLSVIGFDDISLAEFIGLTTVRQPLYLSGRRAGIRLLEMLGQGPSPGELPPLPPLELIARHTTAQRAATPNRSTSLSSSDGKDLVTKVSDTPEPAERRVRQVPRRM